MAEVIAMQLWLNTKGIILSYMIIKKSELRKGGLSWFYHLRDVPVIFCKFLTFEPAHELMVLIT